MKEGKICRIAASGILAFSLATLAAKGSGSIINTGPILRDMDVLLNLDSKKVDLINNTPSKIDWYLVELFRTTNQFMGKNTSVSLRFVPREGNGSNTQILLTSPEDREKFMNEFISLWNNRKNFEIFESTLSTYTPDGVFTGLQLYFYYSYGDILYTLGDSKSNDVFVFENEKGWFRSTAVAQDQQLSLEEIKALENKYRTVIPRFILRSYNPTSPK